MRSWLTALVCVAAAAVGHGGPILRKPTSKDALQAAIHKYNAGSGQENLYKLTGAYCIAMKELTQGREYEIGFSLMETVCTKGMEDRMQQCAFMENGTALTCNGEITIQYDVPRPVRTSVTCVQN
ncbi:cathelicidin-related peptide Oh-Cath-like [Mobula hypostoma]|uniref:cathelicidin-related peptide Oh-Cath-like n=1 Tax=Mobula hypostoma TaxID=723540 RepID=UPI002FC388D9